MPGLETLTICAVVVGENGLFPLNFALSGLSCGTRAGSSVSVVACGVLFPDQGSNPSPLVWEHGVLATGPAGKTQAGDF